MCREYGVLAADTVNTVPLQKTISGLGFGVINCCGLVVWGRRAMVAGVWSLGVGLRCHTGQWLPLEAFPKFRWQLSLIGPEMSDSPSWAQVLVRWRGSCLALAL